MTDPVAKIPARDRRVRRMIVVSGVVLLLLLGGCCAFAFKVAYDFATMDPTNQYRDEFGNPI